MSPLRLVHLSDPHLGPVPWPGLGALVSKRVFGYVNFMRNRQGSLQGTILEDLLADLKAQRPGHICLTGDLINIALPFEFAAGATFLDSLGAPDRVSCVPGNHDAYVPGAAAAARQHWGAYMAGDDGVTGFPYLKERGGIALIGVSSAVATPPLSARGRVGAAQRRALAALLDRTDHLYKIVLIHHPPDPRMAPYRRRLADGAQVIEILQAGCADLVLHGHNHKAMHTTLPTARGDMAIVGVPSASSTGTRHEIAAYGVIDVDLADGRVTLTRRAAAGPGGAFCKTETITLPTPPQAR